MRLPTPGRPHLTYCTNIHRGESWPEVRANVATHVTAVKARVAPDRPFGVGLRLSGAAAAALAQPDELAAFHALLAERGLYVFTINGFPYGAFHGTAVKEAVYRPDWREDARLAYTDQLGAATAYTYSSRGWLTRVVDPLNYITTTVYDTEGNVTNTIDGRGNKTTYSYDALNRVTQVKDPLGNLATVAYDTVGNVPGSIDQRGNRTTYSYDALNRLTQVKDAVGIHVPNDW